MAAGRTLFGLGMAIAPRPVAMAWVGRDVAMGAGATTQLLWRADARPWIAAELVADATDFAATVIAGDDIPAPGRRAALAMAGGATVVNLVTLLAIGDGSGGSSKHAEASTAHYAGEVTVPSEQTADGMGSVVIGGESTDP